MSNTACDCGSEKLFNACCEPYLSGEAIAPTAESLMRARYTAYVHHNYDFLKKSLTEEGKAEFDLDAVKKWATESEWQGLEIKSTEGGGPKDTKGTVEFEARFTIDGEDQVHHELSQFKKGADGQWYFVDGKILNAVETYVRETPKIGRNDPCSCGSGKKYKKCCGG